MIKSWLPRRQMRSRKSFRIRLTKWSLRRQNARKNSRTYKLIITSWLQIWKRWSKSLRKRNLRRLSFVRPWTITKWVQIRPKLRSLNFASIPQLVTFQSKHRRINPKWRTTFAKEDSWAVDKILYTIEAVMLYTIALRSIWMWILMNMVLAKRDLLLSSTRT